MSDKNSLFMDSPVGSICVIENQGFLSSIQFNRNKDKEVVLSDFEPNDALAETRNQLYEYFDKNREEFDLPQTVLGTEFEKRVWELTKQIPYGKTISYSDLAVQMGDPTLTRAVAKAVAANPILIVVPCHRVIGKDGSLTGYAGGIQVKKALLELEGAINFQYSIL